jgi:glycosyltransferase involved in cell wall biosynthesis
VPRISLVIPAFNEEQYLPRLLESVERARMQYSMGPDQVEVIVADNLSTDATAEVAAAWHCRVTRVEEPAIAAARNGGAAVATGEIVAFIDADSIIHPETFNAIDRTLTEDVVVGATGLHMSRNSLGIALSMLVAKAVVWIGGLDAGVVFCRRKDWEAVGGYNRQRRWAEDVEFFLALKRLGRSRGQRSRRARGARAITSARKFDRFGDWHYFGVLLRLPIIFSRTAADRFIQEYWYDGRR